MLSYSSLYLRNRACSHSLSSWWFFTFRCRSHFRITRYADRYPYSCFNLICSSRIRWLLQLHDRTFFGRKLFHNPNSRIFKQSYLDKTHEFYKKYGGKTIILARFVPIVRTFAPFIAGMGKMHYYYFMIYNLIGGAIWVVLFCYAGYFFGDLPFVQENLKLLIIAIIFISILPAIIEILRAKLGSKQ